uniref:Translation elongation factor EF1B beta/delta subunit guanine nucleotide exchange domain-containing protein n=1 Tax=Myotis lucifugus TaxID=59463 RepID=G1PY69_MYOLU
MGFGDLRSPTNLQVLNDYLRDKSYSEGYVPSQMLHLQPNTYLYHPPHWYNHHIKSYEKEKASLSGVKKALSKYGPANVEDTTGSGATDSKNNYDSDLFGSDEEEQSKQVKRLREEHLAQYESKKAKKASLAKSSILLDVKLWDDKSDMAKVEHCVRSIQAESLDWGSSKLVPVGYGIKIAETDALEERIMAFEGFVQSMTMAAFCKI